MWMGNRNWGGGEGRGLATWRWCGQNGGQHPAFKPSRISGEMGTRRDADAGRRPRGDGPGETAAGRRAQGDGRAVTATGRQSRGDGRRETGAGRRWRGDGGAVRRWRRGWGRDVNDMKMIIFFLLFSTSLFRKLKKKKKRSNWILHTS